MTRLLLSSDVHHDASVSNSYSLSLCSNEKDTQGENMFMRCVSELVIESREVSDHINTETFWSILVPIATQVICN